MIETHRRHIVKSVVWRLVAFLNILIISLVVLNSPGASLTIACLDQGIKLIIYYLHEVAWSHIDYGRTK